MPRPPYADIYVLAPSRSKATVKAFLERFLPERAETANEYWIPQRVDNPHTVLHTSAEAIAYCCGNTSETFSIYWRRVGEVGPAYAMVCFTGDCQLILGLSADQHAAEGLLADLRRHTGSAIGYITVEGQQPQTAAEFRRIAREASA